MMVIYHYGSTNSVIGELLAHVVSKSGLINFDYCLIFGFFLKIIKFLTT